MTSKLTFLYSFLEKTAQTIYPNVCLQCDAEGENGIDLCQRCFQNLPWIEFCCQKCALPLTSDDAKICGACTTQKYFFDQTIAPFQFEGFIRDAIYKFKFNQKLNQGKLLAHLFLCCLENREYSLPDVIIPVPLYKKRLRKRGYNQALEVAKIINKKLNCDLSYTDIYRNRVTSAQMELPAKQRYNNVKNAFSLVRNSKDLKNKHICIVDDVMTTGNTVNEVAKCLKKAGAKKVDVWCIARVHI